jgi:glycosyltransferase involved in cell wall biosynthesis
MKINVIIATYNRCEDLKKCLDSLLLQECDGTFNFEVTVVDNGSKDKTKEIVLSYVRKFNGNLKYLCELKTGKSNAVNLGIKESDADILAFTDDDVITTPNWLLNLCYCFNSYHCDGVGGKVLPLYPDKTPVWIKENADLLVGPIVLYDYGDETKPYSKPMYEFLGANFAFKRSLFTEFGLFRTDVGPGQGTLGEDTELINRFLKAGKKLYYCGKAFVWHPVENNRMTLKYIGYWNYSLARYRVAVDEEGKINLSLVYWFSIPRYLIGEVLQNIKSLLMFIFDRRRFLLSWIDLCRNCGKAIAIRKIYMNTTTIKKINT